MRSCLLVAQLKLDNANVGQKLVSARRSHLFVVLQFKRIFYDTFIKFFVFLFFRYTLLPTALFVFVADNKSGFFFKDRLPFEDYAQVIALIFIYTLPGLFMFFKLSLVIWRHPVSDFTTTPCTNEGILQGFISS